MPLTDALPGGVAGGINSAVSSKYNPVNMGTFARDWIDEQANSFLLKPATMEGIAGFLFDYDNDMHLTAENDVTDHYTEQNKFFSDHVAIRPIEITLRGFCGELAMKAPQGVLGALATLQNKLTQLPGILGKYTPGAVSKVSKVITKATNQVNQVDNVLNRTKNLISLVSGGLAATSQIERAWIKLMGLRELGAHFTLQTPVGYLSYMAEAPRRAVPRHFVIRRLVFIQDEQTRQWVDISVTMKEIRFADVTSSGSGATSEGSKASNSGRAIFQRQDPTNKGQTTGSPVQFDTFRSQFAGNLDL
jgi:hypothetical protein